MARIQPQTIPIARIEFRFLREIFPQLAFGVGNFLRHFDACHDNQIPIAAGALWQTTAADAEFLAVLHARRNFDVHAAVQRRHVECSRPAPLPTARVRFRESDCGPGLRNRDAWPAARASKDRPLRCRLRRLRRDRPRATSGLRSPQREFSPDRFRCANCGAPSPRAPEPCIASFSVTMMSPSISRPRSGQIPPPWRNSAPARIPPAKSGALAARAKYLLEKNR